MSMNEVMNQARWVPFIFLNGFGYCDRLNITCTGESTILRLPRDYSLRQTRLFQFSFFRLEIEEFEYSFSFLIFFQNRIQ